MESGPTARPKKIMFWGAGATAALLGGIVVALKKKSHGQSMGTIQDDKYI